MKSLVLILAVLLGLQVVMNHVHPELEPVCQKD